MTSARPRAVAAIVAAVAATAAIAATRAAPAPGVTSRPAARPAQPSAPAQERDRHSRPRALAVDAAGDRLYVALSTADRLGVVDIASPAAPRLETLLPICAFPAALAPLPQGGVVVACRFDPGLRVVTRAGAGWRVRVVDAGPEHGHRGLAVDGRGQTAYVASPARGGVKIVSLTPDGDPSRARLAPTAPFPQALRYVPADAAAGRPRPLLLVSSFIGHTVTVHDILDSGDISQPVQTIATEAPVLDLAVVSTPPAGPAGGADSGDDSLAGALLLLTHEDRPLTRRRLSVEGLDSVVLLLPPGPPGARAPFIDAGPGRRAAINLGERPNGPLAELESLAVDAATGRIAIAGAGTDNLLVVPARAAALGAAPAIPVGAHPTAVALLADGRAVTADRLSDTLTFVGGAGGAVTTTLSVGVPDRPSPAERGELLFFSRALVPNNVADGSLSLYTCAACHADGHIDGRRHPSKRDRFFSMTKTCRGLGGTEPFLSLGHPDTLPAFADNIVSTHAQGALDAPDSYDRYSVPLRLRSGDGGTATWTQAVLTPEDVRAALAAYMASIPVERSPFVAPGRERLTPAERRGLALFRVGCGGCHQLVPQTTGDQPSPPAGRALEAALLDGRLALTSARRYDVGTPVLGEGGNNPPSLRGVWSAAPYLSDGSAATLESLIRRTNPDAAKVHAAENARTRPAFSAAQTADLAAFLRTL